MWIDRIVELVPRERLVAIKHVSLAEDHLHDHFPAQGARPPMPVMPGSLIIEGMAQTAGILVGHAESFREKVILAKVTRAELLDDARPGHTLRYIATIENLTKQGASTRGIIELLEPDGSDPRPFGSVDLVFSHIDHNITGTEFPDHNFVFSESFRTLLRTSGIADDFADHEADHR